MRATAACSDSAGPRMADDSSLHGKLTNLSKGGCFVETKTPFGSGTAIRLQFIAMGVKVRAEGEVRTVVANQGMGVMFTSFEGRHDQKLECLLNGIMAKDTSSSARLVSRHDIVAQTLEQWFQSNDQLSREQYLDLISGTYK